MSPWGEVLCRGIIFIDLALAQIAAVGVLVARMMHWESPWMVQASAIGMALVGAWLLGQSEKRWPKEQKAIIGISFILASSAGVLLLANDPHGGEQLKTLLAGQILWVDQSQLWQTAVFYCGILIAWFGFINRFGPAGFYVLFALTVSVQLVGVYLVFASLILPALATINTATDRRLVAGYLVALLGYCLGVMSSAVFALPTGAMVVCSLALVAVMTRLFFSASPSRG